MEHAYSGQALVTFTYDDGRRDNYDIALPLHEEMAIPATFSIIAGRIHSPHWIHRHMTAFEVADAARRGVELSSHTMTHQHKLPTLGDDDLRYELRESHRILSSIVPRNREVTSMCVPFSKTDSRVTMAAARHYRFIRIDGNQLNDVGDTKQVVSSHPVRNDTNFEVIRDWIDRAVETRRWLVLMFHGISNDAGKLGKYDTSADILENVLRYVASLGPQRILPASFEDIAGIQDRHAKRERAAARQSKRPAQHQIAEAEGYLITYHKNKRDNSKLVISFGGLPSKKTATGFGSKFILEQGWDHLFVAQAPMSQYQQLSLEQFYEAVSPLIDDYDVFAYGSSLGAYAALYYGGSVNAKIISAAPKNSAHPLVLQKRFAHVGFHHKELTEVPHSSSPPLILFDPHRKEETKFIRRLVSPAYPEARLIELPHAGHTVLDTMRQTGQLKSFIRQYVETGVIDTIDLREEGIPVFSAERGRELLNLGEVERALDEFTRSLRIGFTTEAAAGHIKALTKMGRVEEARAELHSYQTQTGSLRGIPEWVRSQIGV